MRTDKQGNSVSDTCLYEHANNFYGVYHFRDGQFGAVVWDAKRHGYQDLPGIFYRKTAQEAFEDLVRRLPIGGTWIDGDINACAQRIALADLIRHVIREWGTFCDRNSAYKFGSTSAYCVNGVPVPGPVVQSAEKFANDRVLPEGRRVFQILCELLPDSIGEDGCFSFPMFFSAGKLAHNVMWKICHEHREEKDFE